MKNYVILCILFLLGVSTLHGQGYVFGIKGGLSIGLQNWGNSFQRDPMFRYHGAMFIESLPEGDQWSLFAQAGYHPRGSAIRNRNFFNPINGNFFRPPADVFLFHNASLQLGAKQKFDIGQSSRWFYSFALRGEYTVDTNLDRYDFFLEQNPTIAAVYPINAYFNENGFLGIRRLNYGFSGGGGLEWQFSKFIGASLEFTINPDFSFQYTQPAIPNVTDPWTGEPRTIPERRIRNMTFELTAGFRFLRKIEYID